MCGFGEEREKKGYRVCLGFTIRVAKSSLGFTVGCAVFCGWIRFVLDGFPWVLQWVDDGNDGRYPVHGFDFFAMDCVGFVWFAIDCVGLIFCRYDFLSLDFFFFFFSDLICFTSSWADSMAASLSNFFPFFCCHRKHNPS
jgi:hypothetical protein